MKIKIKKIKEDYLVMYDRIKKRSWKTTATLKPEVLKKWLKKNDISVKSLACDLGCNKRSVHYWLNNNRSVTRQFRLKLSVRTGIYMKDLFNFTYE
jgi:plasmid maintenance system antidote protein VapI